MALQLPNEPLRAAPNNLESVRNGVAVLMSCGYRPNVALPEQRIAFFGAIDDRKEIEDRQFGVVNIQPGFQQGSSGL